MVVNSPLKWLLAIEDFTPLPVHCLLTLHNNVGYDTFNKKNSALNLEFIFASVQSSIPQNTKMQSQSLSFCTVFECYVILGMTS